MTGLEMGARTKEYLALILWSEIVGEQVARITAVQSVRDGVLYVDVESSVWAQELHFYVPDLISRLNSHVGPNVIRDIHFRIKATLKRDKSSGRPASPRPSKKTTPDIQLTLQECHEIREIALRVTDPELRDALSSTITSYRRLERHLEAQGWKRCAQCHALHKRKRGCPFCTLGR